MTTANEIIVKNKNKEKSVEFIDALSKEGAEGDLGELDGAPELILAALLSENPGVIDALIRGGSNINTRDTDGWTALMAAAIKNENPEVINALLRGGANAKIRNSDRQKAIDLVAMRAWTGKKNLKGTDAYWALQDASY